MARSHGGRDLVPCAAAVALLLVGTGPGWARSDDYGHVSSRDRVLRSGCHHYRYRYVVKPGSHDWMLETWLYDPRGGTRGAGDFAPGSDPRRGHSSFGLCRSTVVPGRFTIRARLRWWTPGPTPLSNPVRHTRWFDPTHFRLHRRHR